jgi:hypothetical protein
MLSSHQSLDKGLAPTGMSGEKGQLEFFCGLAVLDTSHQRGHLHRAGLTRTSVDFLYDG